MAINMLLSSRKLDAFYVLSKNLNFCRAADELCVTQSALSQRISQLEESLGTKLFKRIQSYVELTQAGHKVLRYCRIKRSLERELIDDFILNPNHPLSGTLTIAGFSSIMRSVIMPTLAPMLKKNPCLQIDFKTRDIRELPEMLYHAEADIIVHHAHWIEWVTNLFH